MIQVQREVEIDAPDYLVWQVITDFRTYPEWTGSKSTISGNVKVGALLKVLNRPKRGKVQLSFFKVIRVIENQELRWIATYVPFGLLKGERYWVLQKIDERHTRLILGEAFMGPLLGVSRKHLERPAEELFEKMCNGLKDYCEMLVKQQRRI